MLWRVIRHAARVIDVTRRHQRYAPPRHAPPRHATLRHATPRRTSEAAPCRPYLGLTCVFSQLKQEGLFIYETKIYYKYITIYKYLGFLTFKKGHCNILYRQFCYRYSSSCTNMKDQIGDPQPLCSQPAPSPSLILPNPLLRAFRPVSPTYDEWHVPNVLAGGMRKPLDFRFFRVSSGLSPLLFFAFALSPPPPSSILYEATT